MVMHARKPQRMSDGYFEKHQTHPYQGSKYSSKRDYERDTSGRSSSSNYGRNDRGDSSPSGTTGSCGGGGGGSAPLNNGNSSYRSNSPDLDSPPRHDIRDRDRDRDRFSYLQKMRERERDVYKKDKYSDKRERRSDRDSEHRTNHDRIERRTSKLSGSTSDKHSGSDDRDNRDRDRDRDLRDSSSKRDRNDRDRDRGDRERDRGDRDRDNSRNDRDRNDRDRERNDRNERNERITRIGDWSEHVSSSGKMYYYNCKTEVSQWEKPKEWIEKERTLTKDQHREYREKDRERDREDRFPRSSTAYNKHSSSSRSSSRLRWPPYEADGVPPAHRRRHEDNPDMDISPGDSTPTSETSYSVSSTPTAGPMNDSSLQQQMSTTGTTAATSGVPGVVSSASCSLSSSSSTATPQPILLANALPRLASHPPTSSSTNPTQMHFSSPNVNVISGGGVIPSVASVVATSSTCLPSVVQQQQQQGTSSNCHRKLDSVLQTSLPASSPTQQSIPVVSHIHHQQQHQQTSQPLQSPVAAILTPTGVSCSTDLHLNSNAPGPPSTSISTYQKVLSQTTTIIGGAIVGVKPTDQIDSSIQKPIQTISTSLLRQQSQPQAHYIGGIGGVTTLAGTPTDTTSSVSNLSGHGNSDSNHSGSNVTNLRENPLNSPLYNLTHMHAMSPLNHNKNAGVGATVMSAYTCNTPFGLKTVESGNSSGPITTNIGSSCGGGGSSNVPGEGPPTPTQELDLSGSSTEQRKIEGTSASLSSLQSCVTSAQSGRSQGPDLSPKLAKYFRADLITHVTNWPADILEKQAQKCSEETHIYGDLQCTKVSADLKCARSLVRITEITATLQEQKIMYLRQQIRRLEELKSQNSFMSDDL